MDAADFPCRTQFQRVAVDALFTLRDSSELAEGYEDDHERLFSLLVALLEVYVRSTIQAQRDRGIEEGQVLGSVAVDDAVYGNQDALADFDKTVFNTWLRLTLTSLTENLEIEY
jgi:hypothetical protein